MKHLRNMRQTFPLLEARSEIMGLSASHVPAEELYARRQAALEAKRAKKKLQPIRVSFTIRPHLPPCYTWPAHVAPSARVEDVQLLAWEAFEEERLRRGETLGPLPSYNMHDYCLRRVAGGRFYESPTGEVSTLLDVAEPCPPQALVARLAATSAQPQSVLSPPQSAAQMRNDRPAASLSPLALESGRSRTSSLTWSQRPSERGERTAVPSHLRRGSEEEDDDATDTPRTTREKTGDAGEDEDEDQLHLHSNHFVFVLCDKYLESERIAATERKTRGFVENLFTESLREMKRYEAERHEQARGYQLQREEFGDARLVIERRETRARESLLAEAADAFATHERAFREPYDALALRMHTMRAKMEQLREQHRQTTAARRQPIAAEDPWADAKRREEEALLLAGRQRHEANEAVS